MTIPKLSICIPTYNRAEKLRSALLSILPQSKTLGEKVEVLVSDNCSTDHTPDVIEWAKSLGGFKYSRNKTNIGAIHNIIKLVNHTAQGEFCWVLPDDDMARPGALERIIDAIEKNPCIDYLFLNVSPKLESEKDSLTKDGRVLSAVDFPDIEPTKCKDLDSHIVDSWENLVDPAVDGVFLGSIMCSVFRREVWCQFKLTIPDIPKTFESLEVTYPHCVVFANTMVGRKAYYIGYPCVIAFWGEQEWIGYVPMIYLVRLHEMLDLYKKNGVSKIQIAKCKKFLLSSSNTFLEKMLLHKNIQGKEYFSLIKFILSNLGYPKELGLLMYRTMKMAIKSKI